MAFSAGKGWPSLNQLRSKSLVTVVNCAKVVAVNPRKAKIRTVKFFIICVLKKMKFIQVVAFSHPRTLFL